MIRRRSFLRRSSKPIPRRKRPNPLRRTPRANLARQCQALWSAAVKRKNEGRCAIATTYYATACAGPIEAAHAFPKGACPVVRYDPDFGLPLCRCHHRLYGNGIAWRTLLFRLWGPALYSERYYKAHSTLWEAKKLDLAAVKKELSA